MTTYVIASKVNSTLLSECQILGEHLAQNSPDLTVKFVIKDESEWKEFIDSVCRSYGFEKKTCPIIYTLEGTLIGDHREFKTHIKERFSKSIVISKEAQKARAKLNLEENEERMRKKKEGDTLGEKIENHLDKLKKKHVSQLVSDAFYEKVHEDGVPFYLRRTNLLRDEKSFKKTDENQSEPINTNRMLNVADEDLMQQLQLQAAAEEESKRDRNYEEFTSKYGSHIEGKVDPQTRVGARPETVPWNDEQHARFRGSAAEKGSQGGHKDYDTTAHDEKKSVQSKKNTTYDSRFPSQRSAGQSSNGSVDKESYKYDLPNTCKLEILKLNRIEKLEDEYVLLAHPYPQMEGEMLLLQTNAADQQDKQLLVYRDYSLRKRLISPSNPERPSAFQKKKQMEMDAERTKLQCLQIDVESPLSTIDWANFALVIQEIKGLGWIQILPAGQKSSMPFQFNMLHILPSSRIPYERVPLDAMIANKLSYQKKNEKQKRSAAATGGFTRPSKAVHDRDAEAAEANMVLLDEFTFPHVVFQLMPSEFTADGLQYGYRKMFSFLGLKENRDIGMTLIVTPQWMFLAPIEQPYHKEQDLDVPGAELEEGVGVYLDGFAYAGILNLQTQIQKWPATAGIGIEAHEAIKALHRQSAEAPAKQTEPGFNQDLADAEVERVGGGTLQ